MSYLLPKLYVSLRSLPKNDALSAFNVYINKQEKIRVQVMITSLKEDEQRLSKCIDDIENFHRDIFFLPIKKDNPSDTENSHSLIEDTGISEYFVAKSGNEPMQPSPKYATKSPPANTLVYKMSPEYEPMFPENSSEYETMPVSPKYLPNPANTPEYSPENDPLSLNYPQRESMMSSENDSEYERMSYENYPKYESMRSVKDPLSLNNPGYESMPSLNDPHNLNYPEREAMSTENDPEYEPMSYENDPDYLVVEEDASMYEQNFSRERLISRTSRSTITSEESPDYVPTSVDEKYTSAIISPESPDYEPTSADEKSISAIISPESPDYELTSVDEKSTSAIISPESPDYVPTSVDEKSTSAIISPESPDYEPTSVDLKSASVIISPESPDYVPTSVDEKSTSAIISPESPDYVPTSVDEKSTSVISPESPEYAPTLVNEPDISEYVEDSSMYQPPMKKQKSHRERLILKIPKSVLSIHSSKEKADNGYGSSSSKEESSEIEKETVSAILLNLIAGNEREVTNLVQKLIYEFRNFQEKLREIELSKSQSGEFFPGNSNNQINITLKALSEDVLVMDKDIANIYSKYSEILQNLGKRLHQN